MALDKDVLEQKILDKLQYWTPRILDDEVVDAEVTEEQQKDGSVKYSIQEQRGPVVLDDRALRAIRPLARAIAEEIIEHVVNHAEVNLTSGRIS